MSVRDDDWPGDDGASESVTIRCQNRRRRQAAVGAASLAVVLGAGAYLVTTQIASRNDGILTQDTNAIAPIAPPKWGEPSAAASASASPSGSPASVASTPTKAAKAAAKRTASASPVPSDPGSVRKQIDAARATAARDGFPLQRPLTPAPGVVRNGSSVSEESQTLPDGGTMRIITAKDDLSGQRELLWAADDGKSVDGSRCTQNFHFSQTGKAAVRPTMLLCWRTSANRSVVVLSIAKRGHPSLSDSVAVIGRRWDKLG
jgi:hypothetical protein